MLPVRSPTAGGFGKGLQLVNEPPHPGESVSLAFIQQMGQPKCVKLKKKRRFSRDGSIRCLQKHLPRQSGVRAARKFHAVHAVADVELHLEGHGKSLDARAVRMDQCPVNIKQNQP